LVFLLYADYKFSQVSQEIATGTSNRRHTVGKADYQALLGAICAGNCPRMIICSIWRKLRILAGQLMGLRAIAGRECDANFEYLMN
jgi:hypothetical protein